MAASVLTLLILLVLLIVLIIVGWSNIRRGVQRGPRRRILYFPNICNFFNVGNGRTAKKSLGRPVPSFGGVFAGFFIYLERFGKFGKLFFGVVNRPDPN